MVFFFSNPGKQLELEDRWFGGGYCSNEIKRHLTPWKESYDQPR